jgi:hypothetical protein
VVERDYLSNPNFNSEYIKSKSAAAAGLCAWVVNIVKYFRIYQVVAPKRAQLGEANKKLEGANKKLSGIRAKVKELQDKVRDPAAGAARPPWGCRSTCPTGVTPTPHACSLLRQQPWREALPWLLPMRPPRPCLVPHTPFPRLQVEALEQGLMRATEDKNAAMAQVGLGAVR